MTRPLSSLVILGGGTAGWMAAAMLARFVPRATRITLVESDAIGTVGVGEATIPQIRLLTRALGLDEDRMLAACEGTFKLGIEFVDWLRPGTRYMHAFGGVGGGMGVVPFHHWWLRGAAKGVAAPVGDYTPAAIAAWAGRFGRDPELTYAYHLDAALLARMLRGVAEAAGVVRVEGEMASVDRDGGSGDLSTLVLRDGRRIEGDFFLDCSGFRSALLGGALGVGFEGWKHWLPCDRAMAVASMRPEGAGSEGALLPYTRATARAAGWQWRIPLQHRTGNGLVYAGEHLSDDAAAALLLDHLDAAPIGEPRPLRFETGKRKAFWHHNVVALGLASGFMEPLESTSIHMVQSAVARLLTLFPGADPDPAARDAYNAQTHEEYDRIRDFLILHYHANARDEPLWQACRAMTLPDTLIEKLRQFRGGGRILRAGDELFTEVAWFQVMVGQGIVPDRWSPLADAMSDAELAAFLSRAAQTARVPATRVGGHADFVARHLRRG